MILDFYSRSQRQLARLCEAAGCPDDLNMRMAHLVYLLGLI